MPSAGLFGQAAPAVKKNITGGFHAMKNLNVAKKLLVAFGVAIGCGILVGAIGIIGMTTINNAMSGMYYQNVLPIEALADMREIYATQRNDFRAIFLSKDQSEVEPMIAEIEETYHELDQAFALYEESIQPGDDETAYFAAKELWMTQFKGMKEDVYALARAGKFAQALPG